MAGAEERKKDSPYDDSTGGASLLGSSNTTIKPHCVGGFKSAPVTADDFSSAPPYSKVPAWEVFWLCCNAVQPQCRS